MDGAAYILLIGLLPFLRLKCVVQTTVQTDNVTVVGSLPS